MNKSECERASTLSRQISIMCDWELGQVPPFGQTHTASVHLAKSDPATNVPKPLIKRLGDHDLKPVKTRIKKRGKSVKCWGAGHLSLLYGQIRCCELSHTPRKALVTWTGPEHDWRSATTGSVQQQQNAIRKLNFYIDP